MKSVQLKPFREKIAGKTFRGKIVRIGAVVTIVGAIVFGTMYGDEIETSSKNAFQKAKNNIVRTYDNASFSVSKLKGDISNKIKNAKAEIADKKGKVVAEVEIDASNKSAQNDDGATITFSVKDDKTQSSAEFDLENLDKNLQDRPVEIEKIVSEGHILSYSRKILENNIGVANIQMTVTSKSSKDGSLKYYVVTKLLDNTGKLLFQKGERVEDSLELYARCLDGEHSAYVFYVKNIKAKATTDVKVEKPATKTDEKTSQKAETKTGDKKADLSKQPVNDTTIGTAMIEWAKNTIDEDKKNEIKANEKVTASPTEKVEDTKKINPVEKVDENKSVLSEKETATEENKTVSNEKAQPNNNYNLSLGDFSMRRTLGDIFEEKRLVDVLKDTKNEVVFKFIDANGKTYIGKMTYQQLIYVYEKYNKFSENAKLTFNGNSFLFENNNLLSLARNEALIKGSTLQYLNALNIRLSSNTASAQKNNFNPTPEFFGNKLNVTGTANFSNLNEKHNDRLYYNLETSMVMPVSKGSLFSVGVMALGAEDFSAGTGLLGLKLNGGWQAMNDGRILTINAGVGLTTTKSVVGNVQASVYIPGNENSYEVVAGLTALHNDAKNYADIQGEFGLSVNFGGGKSNLQQKVSNNAKYAKFVSNTDLKVIQAKNYQQSSPVNGGQDDGKDDDSPTIIGPVDDGQGGLVQ
jgi:hypothetical protein